MSGTTAKILIADDQPAILEALELLLKGKGHKTVAVSSPAGILKALEEQEFDAGGDGGG